MLQLLVLSCCFIPVTLFYHLECNLRLNHHRFHLDHIRKTSTWHPPPLSVRVQVEFYVNENTFKERLKLFFIKNQRSSKWMGHRDVLTSWPEPNWTRTRPFFSLLRFEDSGLQLLPEAAHLSAVHDPSGDGRSRSGHQSQRRTAELRQQQMVGGTVALSREDIMIKFVTDITCLTVVHFYSTSYVAVLYYCSFLYTC